MNDNIGVTGALSIILRDEYGVIKQEIDLKNLVVTAGKEFIASRMAGVAPAVMGWIAVGTGTTAADLTQTALVTEVTRVATSVSGGTATAATVLYATSFAAGVGTGALTEAGIFNAAAAGAMLARTVFAVINKGDADVLDISWTITIG